MGSASSVTIAGLNIGGSVPRQIMVRGRGPSVNIEESLRLADPVLVLRSFPDGVKIGSNNNWGDAENADEVAATGAAPGDPLDSALLLELEPGQYTAILRGAGGGQGVGIIEVLDLTGR